MLSNQASDAIHPVHALNSKMINESSGFFDKAYIQRKWQSQRQTYWNEKITHNNLSWGRKMMRHNGSNVIATMAIMKWIWVGQPPVRDLVEWDVSNII